MQKPQNIAHRLEQHLFRFDSKPGKPVTLLNFMNHPICTVGNISNIQGPAKSAKSAVLGAMMAATVKALAGIETEQDAEQGALLGFACDLRPDPDNSVILHFDTEQSSYDHHQHVWKALERTGAVLTSESQMPLLSYSLVEFNSHERKEAIRLTIERLKQSGKKIPCIFLDGVADIVSDPNNFEESAALVDWFHRLAGENQCTVITVLHENPVASDSGSGKTRGHLGSQIERKSETNLRVAKNRVKNKEGVWVNLETSTIWADRARHCHIPKHQGISICYNQVTRRHEIVAGEDQQKPKMPGVSVGVTVPVPMVGTHAPKPTVPSKEVEAFLKKTFPKNKLLKRKDLKKKVMDGFGCSDGTANNRLNEWLSNGWIHKGRGKTSPYSLKPPDAAQSPALSNEPQADKMESAPQADQIKPDGIEKAGSKESSSRQVRTKAKPKPQPEVIQVTKKPAQAPRKAQPKGKNGAA